MNFIPETTALAFVSRPGPRLCPCPRPIYIYIYIIEREGDVQIYSVGMCITYIYIYIYALALVNALAPRNETHRRLLRLRCFSYVGLM